MLHERREKHEQVLEHNVFLEKYGVSPFSWHFPHIFIAAINILMAIKVGMQKPFAAA
jgi:hypothetical protein